MLPGTRCFDLFRFNATSDSFVSLTSDLTEYCQIGDTEIAGGNTCTGLNVDPTTSETIKIGFPLINRILFKMFFLLRMLT